MSDLSMGDPMTAYCLSVLHSIAMQRKTYLHHAQVLGTIVRLEQGITGPAFDENAAE